MEAACCSRETKKIKRHHSCCPFDEEVVILDDQELTCKSRCGEAQPQPSEDIFGVFRKLFAAANALQQQIKEMADLSCHIQSHDQERKVIHQRAKVEPLNKRVTRSSSIIILDDEDTSPQKSVYHSSMVSSQALQERVTMINDLLSKQDLFFRKMKECLDLEFSVRRQVEDLTLLKQKIIELEKELEKKERVMVTLEKNIEAAYVLFEVQILRGEMEKETMRKQVALEQKSSFDRAVKAEVSSKFLKILNSELTCNICSEWFIKATTTQCSHTFCRECLTTWSRNSGNCPLCRTRVTVTVPTLVIDNHIAKLVENLSVEDQLKRNNAIQERERRETTSTQLENPAAEIIILLRDYFETDNPSFEDSL